MDRRSHCGKICRDVVLEAVFAHVMEQSLQVGNFYHPGATERFEWVVRERATAYVTTHSSIAIVG